MIALLVALTILLCLSACGEKTDAPSATNDMSPTETETSEVSEEIETTTPACTHNFKESYYRAPNCTEQGEARYTCTLCSEETTKVLPALGHQGSGASCTEDAICAVCGDVAEPAWGHLDHNGICEYCGISLLPEGVTNEEAFPEDLPWPTEE